jgi:uncharacterized protein YyaL (SSP411 family)
MEFFLIDSGYLFCMVYRGSIETLKSANDHDHVTAITGKRRAAAVGLALTSALFFTARNLLLPAAILLASACSAIPKNDMTDGQLPASPASPASPAAAAAAPATQAAEKQATNRLIHESSPYLLQHAHNPVDWYPWGTEAFTRSRKEGKPILLSIGYSACHWCHVMAHESFEDPATAALMNKNFVCIKVDREQRPDVDDVYMNALFSITGSGGWPLTMFLTPDLKPFWGGTYFPNKELVGIPSFKSVLSRVAEEWQRDRPGVERGSDAIVAAITSAKSSAAPAAIDLSTNRTAIDTILEISDREWGGFATVPKFPPSSAIDFLMRAQTAPGIEKKRRLECSNFTTLTLDKMALGGIHDQFGGGFARYSTDQKWHVPHFEKMLYNNALLSKNYLDGYLLTKKQYWADVARDTLNFSLKELCSPDGGFYSSLDADSDGVEGKFYRYTPGDITSILGDSDGRWLSTCLNIDSSEASVPWLPDGLDAIAGPNELARAEKFKRFALLKSKVFNARKDRVHPKADTKIIAGWNALMISSLVAGYKALDDERYLVAGKKTANLILSRMIRNGQLMRLQTTGENETEAFLDDYAFTVQAFLDLAGSDPDPIWLSKAQELSDTMVNLFYDKQTGQFNYKSNRSTALVAKPKDDTDEPIPAGHSVAIMNLLRLSRLTDRHEYLEMAKKSLQVYAGSAAKQPAENSYMLSAVDFYLSPSSEIVFVVDSSKSNWKHLQQVVNHSYLPHSVILYKDVNSHFAGTVKTPLTEAHDLIDSKPAVYVCHNFTCDRPITDVEQLSALIKRLASEN